MKEFQVFQAHSKAVTCISWHPLHETLFVTRGADGVLIDWNARDEALHELQNVYESEI